MSKKKKQAGKILLDTQRESSVAKKFLSFARKHVIGQERILAKVADALERSASGFRNLDKPLGSLLILGPSGVGKTLIPKMVAEFLFGNPNALTRINGQDYSEKHYVANLLGSPHGYVGHTDEPLFTQEKLDRFDFFIQTREFLENLNKKDKKKYKELKVRIKDLKRFIDTSSDDDLDEHDEKMHQKDIKEAKKELENVRKELNAMGSPVYDPREDYLSVVLFDEIERAHVALHNVMFPILDEGRLQLSSKKAAGVTKTPNGIVRFNNSFIFVTSNIGSDVIGDLLRTKTGDNVKIGFHPSKAPDNGYDEEIYKLAINAARRDFQGPFLNRFDYVLAARPLVRSEFESILDLQIARLAETLFSKWNFPVLINISRGVRKFIVDEATDKPEEQARLIEKKLKHHIIDKLVRFKLTDQINDGDIIEARMSNGGGKKKILFYKLPRTNKKKLYLPTTEK